MQLLLWAARPASCMKYWSQLGRSRASLVKSSLWSASFKLSMLWFELRSRSCARCSKGASPVPEEYKWSSFRRTNSARSGAWRLYLIQRLLKRSHRRDTGASTLISRKNGRRDNTSRMPSSQMSVVTHLSCHLLVTNSNSSSMSEKMVSLDSSSVGTRVLSAAFSTAGVAAVRTSCMRRKLCSFSRKSAIHDLPEQIAAVR